MKEELPLRKQFMHGAMTSGCSMWKPVIRDSKGVRTLDSADRGPSLASGEDSDIPAGIPIETKRR